MGPGDWPQDESMPHDGQSSSSLEREAAITAAQQLLAGPSVTVPRALLLQLSALLREAQRLLERVLSEDEGSTGTGAQQADDTSAAE
jgi:hypothetical protein